MAFLLFGRIALNISWFREDSNPTECNGTTLALGSFSNQPAWECRQERLEIFDAFLELVEGKSFSVWSQGSCTGPSRLVVDLHRSVLLSGMLSLMDLVFLFFIGIGSMEWLREIEDFSAWLRLTDWTRLLSLNPQQKSLKKRRRFVSRISWFTAIFLEISFSGK